MKMAPSKGNRNNFRKKKPDKNIRTLTVIKKDWPEDAAKMEMTCTELLRGGTKHPQ